jgi:hypothetical protein
MGVPVRRRRPTLCGIGSIANWAGVAPRGAQKPGDRYRHEIDANYRGEFTVDLELRPTAVATYGYRL